jgi:hypothetical protein
MCLRYLGFGVGCLAAAISVAIHAAAADDFPVLKPGLWEYRHTNNSIQGQVSGAPGARSVRQCANPSEDMKKKWTRLAGGDCQFSPITHDGSRYTYRSVCKRYDVEFHISSVVTVQSDSEYSVNTESRRGSGASNETLVAHRVGNCIPSG